MAEHTSLGCKHALWIHKDVVFQRIHCQFSSDYNPPVVNVLQESQHADNFLDPYQIDYRCNRDPNGDVLVNIDITVDGATSPKVLSTIIPAFYSPCQRRISCDRIPQCPHVSLRDDHLSTAQNNFDAFGNLCYECAPADIKIDVQFQIWFMHERNPALSHYSEPSKWRVDGPKQEQQDTDIVLDGCTLVAGITRYEEAECKRIRVTPAYSLFDQKDCVTEHHHPGASG